MHNSARIAALILALLVGACSHAPKKVQVKDIKNADSAMVYGQIILPTTDWQMAHVMVQRVGKVYVGAGMRGIGERVHVLPDGRFVAENVTPGKYMLGGFIIGQQLNSLGKSALDYQIEVKPGGLHYLGTYRYVNVKGANIVRPGQFDLEPVKDNAQQAQLLQWLVESSANTGWQPKLQRELGKYRRYLKPQAEAGKR